MACPLFPASSVVRLNYANGHLINCSFSIYQRKGHFGEEEIRSKGPTAAHRPAPAAASFQPHIFPAQPGRREKGPNAA